MTIHDPLSFLVLGIIFWGIVKQLKSDRSLDLDSEKFWSLVQSQEKPVVLLATRGLFIKRLAYVFPYQGILFTTEARYTEAPDGVKLLGAGEAFNIP